MEGISPWPATRADQYARQHPEVSIWRAGALWRAWIPDEPDSTSGTELTPCSKLTDLLDRLDKLLAKLDG
jgi:hypothetical protein